MNRRGLILGLGALIAGAVLVIVLSTPQDEAPSVEFMRSTPEDAAPSAQLVQREEAADSDVPILRGTKGQTPARRTGIGATLGGRVVDKGTGEGIGGAKVIAYSFLNGEAVRVAVTDAEGRYRLEGLEPAPWWLFVWHPEYVSPGLAALLARGEHDPHPDIMCIGVGTDTTSLPDRRLELVPGRRIEGRVVDTSGRPVAGVKIRLKDGAWTGALDKRLPFAVHDVDRYFPLHSDARGRFVVASLPSQLGEIRLGAAGPGTVSRWSDAISVDPGEGIANVVLEVVEAATVTGHVRHPDGAPATPVEVSPSWDSRRRMYDSWAADWDFAPVREDGSYVVEGLPPIRISLEADWVGPGAEGSSVKVATLAPGETRRGVDFLMPFRYMLRGRLLGPDGEPLAHERVALLDPSAEPDDDEEYLDGIGTEDDGSFLLTAPTPLVKVIHVVLGPEDRILNARQRLPATDVVFHSERRPLIHLEFRVLDGEGGPVPRFTVQVVSRVVKKRHICSFGGRGEGRDGIAALDIPVEAPFTVEVRDAKDHEGGTLALGTAIEEVTSLPAGGVVEVVLPFLGEVRGRVVGPDGRAVPGVVVTLTPNPGASDVRLTPPLAADGSFAVRTGYETAVSCMVEVATPSGYALERPVQHPTGRPVPTIVLRRAETVTGQLIAPRDLPRAEDGSPLGVRVSWSRPAGHGSRRVVAELDEEGRWRVDRVPAGVDVYIRLPADELMQHGYRVPADPKGVRAGDPEITIRLVDGLVIAGRCLTPAGRPARRKHLTVYAYDPTDPDAPCPWCEVSAEDGTFVLRGLSPVDYMVDIVDTERDVTLEVLRVTAGKTDLVVRLARRGTLRVRLDSKRNIDVKLVGICVCEAGTHRLVHRSRDRDTTEFDVPGLPAHIPLDVAVWTLGGLVGSARNVRAGGEITLEVVEQVPLQGLLQLPAGRELPPFEGLYAVSDRAFFPLDLSSDGTFDDDYGVAPGRYDLHFVASDGTVRVIARNVEADTEDLEIDWR